MDQTKTLFDSIDEGDDMNSQVQVGNGLGTEMRDDMKSPTKSYITISQVRRGRWSLVVSSS
jgi:hypothetical protein